MGIDVGDIKRSKGAAIGEGAQASVEEKNSQASVTIQTSESFVQFVYYQLIRLEQLHSQASFQTDIRLRHIEEKVNDLQTMSDASKLQRDAFEQEMNSLHEQLVELWNKLELLGYERHFRLLVALVAVAALIIAVLIILQQSGVLH